MRCRTITFYPVNYFIKGDFEVPRLMCKKCGKEIKLINNRWVEHIDINKGEKESFHIKCSKGVEGKVVFSIMIK